MRRSLKKCEYVAAWLGLAFFIFSLCIVGLRIHKRFQIQPFVYVPKVRTFSEDAFAAWICSDPKHVCKPGVKIMEVRSVRDFRVCVDTPVARECIFTMTGYYNMEARLDVFSSQPILLQ